MEVKFRGLSTGTNDWVYGDLIKGDKCCLIVNGIIDSTEEYIQLEYWEPVIPKTVGQYTGKTDKNDREIYQGDTALIEVIPRFHGKGPRIERLEVKWNNCLMQWTFEGKDDWLVEGSFWHKDQIEITGNIHENKEV